MFHHILVPLDGSPRAEQALPVAARLASASGGTVLLLRVVGLPTAFVPYPAPDPGTLRAIIDADLAKARNSLEALTNRSSLSSIRTEIEVGEGYSGCFHNPGGGRGTAYRPDCAVQPRVHRFPTLGAGQCGGKSRALCVRPGASAAAGILCVAEEGEDARGAGEPGRSDVIAMATHGYGGFERWAMSSVTERVLTGTKLPLLMVRPREYRARSRICSCRTRE